MPVVFKSSFQPVGARVQKGPVARCYSRRALRGQGTRVSLIKGPSCASPHEYIRLGLVFKRDLLLDATLGVHWGTGYLLLRAWMCEPALIQLILVPRWWCLAFPAIFELIGAIGGVHLDYHSAVSTAFPLQPSLFSSFYAYRHIWTETQHVTVLDKPQLLQVQELFFNFCVVHVLNFILSYFHLLFPPQGT